MGTFKAVIDVYILYKFGGLLSGISAVNTALELIHLRPPRGRTFVSLLLAMGATLQCRAIRWALPQWLCHAFLVFFIFHCLSYL